MLIKEVFEQFLAEQQSRLAPKTYRDYASVIELFEHQLEGYAWNNLANGQQAYETAQKKGKSFIDLYDHTHIADNVREFLDYFVPRKVMAGHEFILKTCPRVIRKFLRWMREKQLVDFTNDEIQSMCENQQQFPESDKTQSSPGYPDCLFVNLHVIMSLSRKSFASCTWGFLCRWPLPKAANISPPMRSFAWFETALPVSWMIALKLRGFL